MLERVPSRASATMDEAPAWPPLWLKRLAVRLAMPEDADVPEIPAVADGPVPLAAPGEPVATPAWPPRPDELAWWPIPRRQRWGERANALIDAGLDWQAAERQAFDEEKAGLLDGAPATTDPATPPPPEPAAPKQATLL